MKSRTPSRSAVASSILLAFAVGGCAAPQDAVPLPGVKGAGDSGYDVSVELPSAANLVEKSEVKVHDVTVGTVKRISLDGWHAVVTVSLENSVDLPANANARVGQKSLLGAEYLELTSPASGATGRLGDGAVIPLSRSGSFPETEDLLAAMSALLNGGGLSNVSGIVRELNTAFADGGTEASGALRQLAVLTTRLSSQRQNIGRLIVASGQLARLLSARSHDIGISLQQISQGITVLDNEKEHLVQALAAVRGLSRVGSRLITQDGADVLADVKELSRVTQKLAAAGDAVPGSLDTLGTVIFPVSAINNVVKGDYLNIAATIDVSLPALERGLFPSSSGQKALDLLLSALGLLPGLGLGDNTAAPTPTTPAPSPGSSGAPVSPTVTGLLGLLGLTGAGSQPQGGSLLGGLNQLLGGQ